MKHCILVKWNSLVNDKDKLQNEIMSVFVKLLENKEIKNVIFRENVIDRDNRFDFLILIEMNKEFLPTYDESAPHHEWKEKYAKFVEKKAIFDFED